MNNLKDLEKSLPSANKNLPTQTFYAPKGRGNTTASTREPASSYSPDNVRGNRGRGRRPPRNQSAAWSYREKTVAYDTSRPFTPQYSNQNRHHQAVNTDKHAQNQVLNNFQKNNKQNKVRNTVEFEPSHEPSDMRILFAPYGLSHYKREITARDVIVVGDLFCEPSDLSIYEALLREVESSEDHQWMLWHCDSHVIADDKKRKLSKSPTFDMVINKLKDYFGMEVAATRFNYFRDTKDWKPYHHDAAALKPEKAAVQNFTAAVSFGVEREASFKHAKNGTTVNCPLPNGTVYTFCNDVNVIWRHGIPQLPPEKQTNEGRISIVAWGWVDGVKKVSEVSLTGS